MKVVALCLGSCYERERDYLSRRDTHINADVVCNSGLSAPSASVFSLMPAVAENETSSLSRSKSIARLRLFETFIDHANSADALIVVITPQLRHPVWEAHDRHSDYLVNALSCGFFLTRWETEALASIVMWKEKMRYVFVKYSGETSSTSSVLVTGSSSSVPHHATPTYDECELAAFACRKEGLRGGVYSTISQFSDSVREVWCETARIGGDTVGNSLPFGAEYMNNGGSVGKTGGGSWSNQSYPSAASEEHVAMLEGLGVEWPSIDEMVMSSFDMSKTDRAFLSPGIGRLICIRGVSGSTLSLVASSIKPPEEVLKFTYSCSSCRAAARIFQLLLAFKAWVRGVVVKCGLSPSSLPTFQQGDCRCVDTVRGILESMLLALSASLRSSPQREGKAVVILDRPERLDVNEKLGDDLQKHWIPLSVPSNIAVVICTRMRSKVDATLNALGVRFVEVNRLSSSQSEGLVDAALNHYLRDASHAIRSRINYTKVVSEACNASREGEEEAQHIRSSFLLESVRDMMKRALTATEEKRMRVPSVELALTGIARSPILTSTASIARVENDMVGQGFPSVVEAIASCPTLEEFTRVRIRLVDDMVSLFASSLLGDNIGRRMGGQGIVGRLLSVLASISTGLTVNELSHLLFRAFLSDVRTPRGNLHLVETRDSYYNIHLCVCVALSSMEGIVQWRRGLVRFTSDDMRSWWQHSWLGPARPARVELQRTICSYLMTSSLNVVKGQISMRDVARSRAAIIAGREVKSHREALEMDYQLLHVQMPTAAIELCSRHPLFVDFQCVVSALPGLQVHDIQHGLVLGSVLQTVTSLSFSGMGLKDNHVTSITAAIQKGLLPSLSRFDISYTHASERVLDELWMACSGLCELKQLVSKGNKMEMKGVAGLAHLLRQHNNSLMEVELEACRLTAESQASIADALHSSTSLLALSLLFNDCLSLEAVTAVVGPLSTCARLEELTVSAVPNATARVVKAVSSGGGGGAVKTLGVWASDVQRGRSASRLSATAQAPVVVQPSEVLDVMRLPHLQNLHLANLKLKDAPVASLLSCLWERSEWRRKDSQFISPHYNTDVPILLHELVLSDNLLTSVFLSDTVGRLCGDIERELRGRYEGGEGKAFVLFYALDLSHNAITALPPSLPFSPSLSTLIAPVVQLYGNKVPVRNLHSVAESMGGRVEEYLAKVRRGGGWRSKLSHISPPHHRMKEEAEQKGEGMEKGVKEGKTDVDEIDEVGKRLGGELGGYPHETFLSPSDARSLDIITPPHARSADENGRYEASLLSAKEAGENAFGPCPSPFPAKAGLQSFSATSAFAHGCKRGGGEEEASIGQTHSSVSEVGEKEVASSLDELHRARPTSPSFFFHSTHPVVIVNSGTGRTTSANKKIFILILTLAIVFFPVSAIVFPLLLAVRAIQVKCTCCQAGGRMRGLRGFISAADALPPPNDDGSEVEGLM